MGASADTQFNTRIYSMPEYFMNHVTKLRSDQNILLRQKDTAGANKVGEDIKVAEKTLQIVQAQSAKQLGMPFEMLDIFEKYFAGGR